MATRSIPMWSLFAALVVAWSAQGAAADSLSDAKDSVEMMISSAYICSEYKHDPAILVDLRDRARAGLVGAGMTASEADSFMDGVLDPIKDKPTTEARRQAACEMIGVHVID